MAGPRFDFFFYGTLVDAEVRALVIGRAMAAEPARLLDHATVPVGRGRFPMIVHRTGAVAPGVVCREASLDEAARLSYFESEGRDYDARRLDVVVDGAAAIGAWVYVPTPRLKRGPGRWDFERWCRFEKPRFLGETRDAAGRIGRDRLIAYRRLWRGRLGEPKRA